MKKKTLKQSLSVLVCCYSMKNSAYVTKLIMLSVKLIVKKYLVLDFDQLLFFFFLNFDIYIHYNMECLKYNFKIEIKE